MAIDPSPCFDRNVHVHPQKTFYPANIPVDHNQLRQLVSCPSDNHLYYVENQHVYCLNTSTHNRTHIVELPFKASCTAAAHGWFCAGGHGADGHFAAVKLPDPPQPSMSPVLDGPLNPQSTRQGLFAGASHHSDGTNPLPYRMRHERLGKYITNSVSIQRLCASSQNPDDDEIVAVLTNNDQAVRIYSLTRSLELTVEHYDFPMNHASISPDGRLMLLVGDKEEGHLYERRSNADVDLSCPDWLFLRKLPLYKPPTAKLSCYFTTAWSSTGRLCATASEHGFVTVFDTGCLRDLDVDPIVAIVPSSRPNSTPGAIRAMCFAPAPWDLLMWTENRGRVCVADLRSGLGSRQVIDLDPNGDDVTEVETIDAGSTPLDGPDMHDFGAEIDFIRRHQRALGEPNNAAAVSFASDYLAHSVERRRLQHEAGVPELDDDPHGLTEQERQILDGLRTTRRRQLLDSLQAMSQREASTAADVIAGLERNEPPRTITYTSGARRRLPSEYAHVNAQEHAEARHENAALGSIRDYMRLSRFEDTVPGMGRPSTQQPRRQTSVVISPSQAANAAHRVSNPNADPWQGMGPGVRSSTPSASANPPSSSNQASQTSDSDSIPDLLPVHSSSTILRSNTRSATIHTIRDRAMFIDAERRRIHELTAGGQRSEALTTRGEAMYARVQRERERAAAERQGERDRQQNTTRTRNTGLDSYEASLFRQMHPGLRHTAVHPRQNPRTDTAPADGIDDSPYPFETWGVGTAGICWGDGGRVVYVGTEKGIFELKMDFEDRKYWAAITLR